MRPTEFVPPQVFLMSLNLPPPRQAQRQTVRRTVPLSDTGEGSADFQRGQEPYVCFVPSIANYRWACFARATDRNFMPGPSVTWIKRSRCDAVVALSHTNRAYLCPGRPFNGLSWSSRRRIRWRKEPRCVEGQPACPRRGMSFTTNSTPNPSAILRSVSTVRFFLPRSILAYLGGSSRAGLPGRAAQGARGHHGAVM